MKRWSSLHAFCENAWRWDQKRSIDDISKLNYFVANILVKYDVIVTAVVSDNEESMSLDGHLGVIWLEAEWENNDMSYHDLECMLKGIELAEDNLIKCGIPFTEDYKFHGKNWYQKQKKNKTIRKALKLEELEKELK